MSDAKYHDRHAAGIYRAIALRFYCRYVQVIAEERDAFYQTVALATAAGWINKLALNELVERERAGKGGAA
jgi:hypothetical protein